MQHLTVCFLSHDKTGDLEDIRADILGGIRLLHPTPERHIDFLFACETEFDRFAAETVRDATGDMPYCRRIALLPNGASALPPQPEGLYHLVEHCPADADADACMIGRADAVFACTEAKNSALSCAVCMPVFYLGD